MLAGKSARDARHPDPHPDVGSGRPCAASGGNGATQADVNEAIVLMPAPADDGQGPAPIETVAGNTESEERARRTWLLQRAGRGLAAGILIGLAVVPTMEVLASMRADAEDAVDAEAIAAHGPDVWMPSSWPLHGAPITPIAPTSARLGTAWGSTDGVHVVTSGIDPILPETARWTPPGSKRRSFRNIRGDSGPSPQSWPDAPRPAEWGSAGSTSPSLWARPSRAIASERPSRHSPIVTSPSNPFAGRPSPRRGARCDTSTMATPRRHGRSPTSSMLRS